MKKTLTVNLGGSVFNIDEDAYQLLDKYLTNLRIHFRKEEGSEEIMNDIEMRISELFGERIRLGYEVISIDQVEKVIDRLGKPEELFDDAEEVEEPTQQKQHKTHNREEQEIPHNFGKKRLMRDPDNRILGGVAGGIAAYLNWDVTAVRLVMILLLFIPYAPIVLIYLILWIVVPVARTATDKLLMRGEQVTMENIGKTVTDGFEKVSDHVNDYVNSGKPRSFLQKLGDLVVSIVGFIIKFCAILIGIICLPVLVIIIFALLCAFFALIAGGGSLLYSISPFGLNLFPDAPIGLAIFGCIGGILLIGIPVFSLIYLICTQFFNVKPLAKNAKWTLFVLWIISVGISIYYYVQLGTMWAAMPWNNLPWNNFTI